LSQYISYSDDMI